MPTNMTKYLRSEKRSLRKMHSSLRYHQNNLGPATQQAIECMEIHLISEKFGSTMFGRLLPHTGRVEEGTHA